MKINADDVVNIMHRYRHVIHSIPLPGISKNEMCMMKIISESGSNAAVSHIAAKMGASPPLVSRTLRSLDKKGFVTRSVRPENRRQIAVALTENGTAAMDAADSAIADFIGEVTLEAGEENAREFFRLMQLMLDVMEKKIERRNANAEDT
ncbi:MAG: MarR family winged helix-turn-helix transcriptional regulator [Oscillospiraceae bacterium]